MTRRTWIALAQVLGILILAAMALPFVLHALRLGAGGLTSDLSLASRFFLPDAPAGNTAIFLHMATGSVITLLAFVQITPIIRAKAPRLHRLSGYVFFCLAIPTALGGLVYIGLRGTIGGPQMSVAFAIYGLCLLVCAVQTLRMARRRDMTRHRQWALRLFFLAIGSWLYRVHYTIWVMANGRLWMEYDFSGPFDRFQNYAFFLPYLLILELCFRFPKRSRNNA